jgi:hypothetical protein
VSDVPAPVGTVGWSITSGWIEADNVPMETTELMLVADDDALVRGVEGPASLAALMHLDRRVLAVRRELDELRTVLLDIAEAAVERLALRSVEST